ncbi:hypothetical protein D3C80_1854410 [compost metagenome]
MDVHDVGADLGVDRLDQVTQGQAPLPRVLGVLALDQGQAGAVAKAHRVAHVGQ